MIIPVDELKRRARGGDLEALQILRDGGFFGVAGTVSGCPVSHAQRRLWIVDQVADGSAAYHIPISLQLGGVLDAAALRRALQMLVRRHESLRTTFGMVDGELRQFVHADLSVPWQEIDLADDQDGEAHARRIAHEHAVERFDLTRGPLLRAALVRLSSQRHLLLFNIHHIAGDLVSLGVLMRELSAHYDALVRGETPSPEPLPFQYKDFAVWQNRLLAGAAERARHRAYWLGQLAGPLSPLDLPADFARPPLKTYCGRLWRTRLDAGLTERIRRCGLLHGMTTFMVLTAALKALLHRYTGQDDIVVGFPLSGRDHPDLAGQIGCFVNTVAVRDQLDAEEPFIALLARVRQTMLGAYEHQIYPFDRLVEELDFPRDMSRSPLFDVSVSLAHTEPAAQRLGGCGTSPFDDGFAAAKVDLSFDFSETDDGLELAIVYCTDLYCEPRIRRTAEHLVRLTAHAMARPETPVGRLTLLSPEEAYQLLVEFNRSESPFPEHETVVDLFRHKVEAAPDAIAVRLGDRELSYGELAQRAEYIARLLAKHGVCAGTRVGLYMEPSLDVPAALLGILAAGGVYVPLDPTNPRPRLEAMLDDAGVTLVLTQTALVERLSGLPGCLCLPCDAVAAVPALPLLGYPLRAAAPGPDAYAIFTSGSTGRAKAALLPHCGLVNVAHAQAQLFSPGPGDHVLQFAALGFDASLFEMVMALCHGAALCLATREQLLPGAALLATLERDGISIVTLPPSALAVLPDAALPRLRVVTVAGEACPAEVVRRWARGRAFFNLYGPTEATIWATAARCEPGDDAPTIGRPIANTRVYLLDRQRQPVPIGVPGELCIAGVGLAREYLNRRDLSAERFVSDPFDTAPGARLYRSGDLARYRPDGAIEFLGRIDQQVKLRGYRIELGEVEATLAQHPQVREAAVVAHEDEPGQCRLVAYMTARAAGAALDIRELRQYVRERLPEYMVPARFVSLDHMPLTANKKIDRRALPAVDSGRPELGSRFVAPRDDLEHAVAGFFADALRIEVGIEDNFFELGGDSLLAMRIVSRLCATFRADISIPQLFRAGNVRALAETVRAALPEGRADAIAAALRRLQAMSAAEKQALREGARP